MALFRALRRDFPPKVRQIGRFLPQLPHFWRLYALPFLHGTEYALIGGFLPDFAHIRHIICPLPSPLQGILDFSPKRRDFAAKLCTVC